MKIEREHVVDEIIGDVKTNKFKIGEDSMGIIIDSLINLYSDPIGSIVREVTSNCYDAMREKDLKLNNVIPMTDEDKPEWFSSNKKVQIEFQEENMLLGIGNAFLFRDFGVGLSKKRVEEIYTLFGNSTKRDNNHQIGGFGIGAKSPFSYTDTFYIVTNHNGQKFSYMLYRGNDAFHMDLLKQAKTTEPNSTEVIIPLNEEDTWKDTRNFVKAINTQLLYFNDIEYINVEEGAGRTLIQANIDYEDDEVAIDLSKQDDSDYNDIHLMVGRVRYPLNYKQISDKLTWDSEQIPCAIKFDVGEIDLVPSREAVRYTDRTKKAIEDKIIRIQRNFNADCKVELESAENMVVWMKQAHALVQNSRRSWRRSFDSIFAVKSYMAKLAEKKKSMLCTLHNVELSCSLLDDDARNYQLFRGFSIYKVTRQANGNYIGGYKLSKTNPDVNDFITLPILFQQQPDPSSEETRKVWLKSKDFYLLGKDDFKDGFIQIRREFELDSKHFEKEGEIFSINNPRSEEIIEQDFKHMSTLLSHCTLIDYDAIDMSDAEDLDEEVGSFETEAERRKRMGKAFLRRIYFKDRYNNRDKVAFSNDEYHISDLLTYKNNGGIVIWGNSGDNDLLKSVAAVCEHGGFYPDDRGYSSNSLDVKSFPVIVVKVAATLNKQLTEFINVKEMFKMKHSILKNWYTARLTKEDVDNVYFFSCFETLNSDLYYKWKELKDNHEKNYKNRDYLRRSDIEELEKLCEEFDVKNHRMLSNLKGLMLYSRDLDLLKHLHFAQNDGTSVSKIPDKKVFLALREYLRFKDKAVVKFKKQNKKKEVKDLASV